VQWVTFAKMTVFLRYLLQGFDQMIEASRSGLPVDLAQVEISVRICFLHLVTYMSFHGMNLKRDCVVLALFIYLFNQQS